MRSGQRVATVSPVPPRHDLDEPGVWIRKSGVLGQIRLDSLVNGETCYRVDHDDGSKGRYMLEELITVQREVATAANERYDVLQSRLRCLEGMVARHNEQLRSLELARAWPLGAVEPLAAEVEPLAAEVERLRGESQSLRAAHDSRRERVAQAVERLREVFPLRPDCDTIEDAAGDACEAHGSALWDVEGLQRLTGQLAELAGKDPDEEHETDDLIEAIEQQLHGSDRDVDLLVAARDNAETLLCEAVDGLTAEVARLKPWAQLAQQLREALGPEGRRVAQWLTMFYGTADAVRPLQLLADFLERLGSLDATATTQGATSEPAEGDG